MLPACKWGWQGKEAFLASTDGHATSVWAGWSPPYVQQNCKYRTCRATQVSMNQDNAFLYVHEEGVYIQILKTKHRSVSGRRRARHREVFIRPDMETPKPESLFSSLLMFILWFRSLTFTFRRVFLESNSSVSTAVALFLPGELASGAFPVFVSANPLKIWRKKHF